MKVELLDEGFSKSNVNDTILDKELKILEGKESDFAKVLLMKGFKISGIVALGFIVLLVVIGAPIQILGIIIPMFIFIFGLIFTIQYFSLLKYAKVWRIIIDEDGIQRFQDKEAMSGGMRFGTKVAEARHGIQTNLFITYDKVSSMKKQTNGYSIKSTSYNFLNGNGEIFLFDGYENYLEAVALIKSNLPKSVHVN